MISGRIIVNNLDHRHGSKILKEDFVKNKLFFAGITGVIVSVLLVLCIGCDNGVTVQNWPDELIEDNEAGKKVPTTAEVTNWPEAKITKASNVKVENLSNSATTGSSTTYRYARVSWNAAKNATNYDIYVRERGQDTIMRIQGSEFFNTTIDSNSGVMVKGLYTSSGTAYAYGDAWDVVAGEYCTPGNKWTYKVRPPAYYRNPTDINPTYIYASGIRRELNTNSLISSENVDIDTWECVVDISRVANRSNMRFSNSTSTTGTTNWVYYEFGVLAKTDMGSYGTISDVIVGYDLTGAKDLIEWSSDDNFRYSLIK